MAQEDLQTRIERLEAYAEINNLMGKYEHYLNNGMFDEIVDLFAQKTPGVTAEIADGGVWEGIEGVKRLFPGLHRQVLEGRSGNLTEHDACCPVIEIAKDLKTAKGLWFSPGVLTRREATGELRAVWIWVKYGCDMVKEDGHWKFWHFHVYITFRTPFDEGWADRPIVGSFNPTKEYKPDRPTTFYRPFHPDRINATGPKPPEPYDTWDGKSMA